MPRTQLSFATCNLYNLNEPNLPMYFGNAWNQDEYDRKIAWTARALGNIPADVWAFQELWHADSLANAFDTAGLAGDYTLLTPQEHAGQSIVCAGAVRTDILEGDAEWIEEFPEDFRLESVGEDDQTPGIRVTIDRFSRPVLHFEIKPREDGKHIHVYVAHLKSKRPTAIGDEAWYNQQVHARHRDAIGAGLSTVRRTAEATALRMILTERTKGTDTPVVLLGDLNDGQYSNTLNILTNQPNYLFGSLGGGDVDLYSAGTMQEYRSHRDVYYTHVYNKTRESLDHILVSQEFYDNSRKRIWKFKGLEIWNDHLHHDEPAEHREEGSADHGIVRAAFEYYPQPGQND